jgi:hypothetical protein
VDRCALFVDAGYVLADGAMAVHGTRHRESVSWDYAGLLQFFSSIARDRTGLPLLRCYWYEATVEGRRTAEHDSLADLPGVKLRLGRMRPGRREGVESEIHRDLATLARNGAVSDALVVSAEEDLAQVVADVQDLGVRVTIVHITVDGNWTISRSLRQECDDLIEVGDAHLRPYVELISGAEPAQDEPQPVGAYAGRTHTNGHGAVSVLSHQQALPAGTSPAPPAIYTAPVVAEYQRSAQPVMNGQPAANAQAAAAGASTAGQQSAVSPQQQGQVPAQQAQRQQPQPDLTGQAQQAQHSQTGPHDLRGAPSMPGSGLQNGTGPGGHALQQAGGPQQGQHQQGQHQQAQHQQAQHQQAQYQQAQYQPGQHQQGQYQQGQQPQGQQQGQHQQGQQPPGQPGGRGAVTALHQQPGGPGPGGMPPGGMPGQGMPGQAMPTQGMPGQSQGMPGQGRSMPGQGPGMQGQAGMPGMPPPGPYQGMPQQGPGGQGQPGGQGGQARGPSSGPPRQDEQSTQHSQPMYAAPPAGFGGPGQNGPGGPPPHPGPGPRSLMQAPGHQPGATLTGLPGQGQPGPGPAHPGDQGQQRRPYPVPPGRYAGHPEQAPPQQQYPGGPPGGRQDNGAQGPYVPQQGPYSGPQPAAHPPVPQAMAMSLADAVQSAHAEGFDFGGSVAREAPALWLEAVLARKPRMPSDLEARLLQDSALPIDSLLHDEVRHALRRGFWDALERARR